MNGATFLAIGMILMGIYVAYGLYSMLKEAYEPPPPEVQKLLDEYEEWKKKQE